MNRSKFLGLVLGVLGVALLGGGIYMAMTYLGTILNAMVDFISANSGAISNCGISVPPMFLELKDQLATTIIPGVYLGVPLAVILISVIMFAGGYFYGRGSFQDQLSQERKHEEEMEQEVERRVYQKRRQEEEAPEESEGRPLTRRKKREPEGEEEA